MATSLPSTGTRSRASAALQFFADTIPTVVVLGLLAVILYFGHESGWKLPKLAALTGTAASDHDHEHDWCDEHSVPESICVECQTDLLPKPEPLGWCKIHGVMECPEHYPNLYQGKGEPQLPKYDTAAAIQLRPRAENNSISTLHQARIQFASEASVAKAGIDIALVEEGPMEDSLEAHGEITFDPTGVSHVSTRAAGTLAKVFVGLGESVQAGQVLALVDAAAVGQAKSRLLTAVSNLQLAKKNVERLAALQDGIGKRQLQEAAAALQAAQIERITGEQALVNLGFELPDGLEQRDPARLADDLWSLGIPSNLAAGLNGHSRSANLFPIVAPQDGEVVDLHVVAGEVVDSQKTLFKIADPRRMWLMLHVAQEHAPLVRPGLEVEFKTDGLAAAMQSTIDWISPAIDAETRMLHARVPIDNRARKLRDTTFADARVILRREPNALIVPKQAVHSTGDGFVIFVRDKNYFSKDAPKLFHVRQVRLGAKSDSHIELLAGGLPGEVIASQGSGALLAQLLRGQLGEGCGHHHH
ncbi:MAG TPA: efflux RND transporter periplasmic adaptor subunit [Pirellulaceae bacterium]|nr:efflux RND transporter periplasmic adaptor subunit [Pirellulaceae bacterium]